MNEITKRDKQEWNRYYKEVIDKNVVGEYIKSIDDPDPFLMYLLRYSKDAKEVLEVGSGKGWDSLHLAKMGKNIKLTLADYSEDAVNFSKKLFKKNGIKANFHVLDITELPFKDNSFDLVFGEGVLAHVPNYGKAFSELVRVCKPQKFIIFTLPNKYRVDNTLYKKMLHFNYTQKDFSFRDVRKLCSKHNVEIKETFGLENFFFTPAMVAGLFGLKKTIAKRYKTPVVRTGVDQEKPMFIRLNEEYINVLTKVNKIPLPKALKLLLGVVGMKRG